MKKVLFILTLTLSLSLDLKLVTDGLSKPVYLCSPKNLNNKLYIVEQRGKIIQVDIDGNNKKTFLDIRKKVKKPIFPGDERGLLGMAFHPDYKNNGYFFLNYIDNSEHTIISKFKYNIDTENFDETILMKIKQPYPNHNGGQLEFGLDGYLYIGMGDGGSAGDPDENAQSLDNLFGKILRIDVNDSLYKIPLTNPYIDNDKALDEIWAYGLRNPWRFSFDEISNHIIIADVGQNSWEEINIQDAQIGGINYGWNLREGKHSYKKNDSNMILTDPLIEYSSNANYGKTLTGLKQDINAIGCSVTGGYVYTRNDIPEIKNSYLFADYCTGKIWGINKSENPNYIVKDLSNLLFKNIKKQFYISSFGVDSKGFLYIVNHSGEIYKIVK